jgi:hypothetical protein
VVDSLAAAVAALPVPRVVWLMVPAGETVDQTLGQLTPHLAEGDIVIDGGNSNYQDSIRRAKALAEDDLGYVDCGTSGGVWGLQEGYSLMVGGEASVVEQIAPLLRTLAPAEDRGWACRPVRRRPLHQDGPQRHRVRNDAGLRRRLRADGAQAGNGTGPGPGGRSVAPRQRGAFVAAGPEHRSPQAQSVAGWHRAVRGGFR